MRRIRVAHVITRMCVGGAQENTFHTVRLANSDRYEVDLVSGRTARSEPSMELSARDAGIEIVHVKHLVRNPSPLNDLRAYNELVRLFRERRYDIVHTHTSKAGYLGRMAAAKAGVPIVVHTPHGHIFFGYFSRLLTGFFTKLERDAAQKTDKLIELTQRGVDQHLAEGVGLAEQWTSIFSGIDLAPFESAIHARDVTRLSLGIDPNEFLIGAVGRLEPVKGFSYFVRAARIVLDSLPSAQFILAGDGACAPDQPFAAFHRGVAEHDAVGPLFLVAAVAVHMIHRPVCTGPASRPPVRHVRQRIIAKDYDNHSH